MALSSDDESSASSGNEYLVTAAKLDLDGTFFPQSASTSRTTAPSSSKDDTDQDSDDDLQPDDDEILDSNALLAEVMRNLERANEPPSNDLGETKNVSPVPNSEESSPSGRKKKILSDEITNLLLQGESGLSSSAFRCDDDDEDEDEAQEEKTSEYTIPKEGVDITLPGPAMMMFGRRKKRGVDFEDELRKRINRRLRANQLYVHKVGLLCWLAHGFHLNAAINDAEILSAALSLVPSGGYPKGRVDIKYLEQFTKWFKNSFRLEFRDSGDGVGRETLLARLGERKVRDYREMVLLYAATLRAIGLNCRLVVSLCAPSSRLGKDELFQNVSEPKEETRKTGKKSSATGEGKNAGRREKTKKRDASTSNIVAENSVATRRDARLDARKRAAEVLAKFANDGAKKSIGDLAEKKKAARLPERPKEEVKSVAQTRRLRSRTVGKNSQSGVDETSGKIEEGTVKLETSPGKRTRGVTVSRAEIASTSKTAEGDSGDEFEEKPLVKKKKVDAGDNDKPAEDFSDTEEKSKSRRCRRKKIDARDIDKPAEDFCDTEKKLKSERLRKKTVVSKSTTNKVEADECSEEEFESGASLKKKKKIDPRRVDKSCEGDSESDEDFKPRGKMKITNASKILQKNVEADDDSDAEFEPKPPAKKKSKVKSRGKGSIDRRVLSSDEEPAELLDAKGAQNIWVEVYVESEESWISVSVVDNKIHCVSEIYKKAPKPVLYVIAWNSAGSLKDVTRRYCPHWLTVTRKQRIDESWWVETLSTWTEKSTTMSRAEDEMLLQRELEQPLPKTVGECKGHPLYALARHLLKFEALYPPECVPLGHLHNGEAIYSRHCVHTLCSRDTWLKKARVVKPSQDAYKIVKSMPKYDKFSGMRLPDQPLELFGKWQTGQYVPPVAKDGIVPRNEYGNVDLFKQCMLPTGTVHMNLPALNRVARKLNIDCVPAVVGFNFGGRGAVPAIEGYVVCEEFEETLRAAWQEDQIESAKRATEKRENRIYGNWKKLIKGLFIRARLAARYDFDEKDDDDDEKPSASAKRSTKKVFESKKVNGKRSKNS